MFPTTHWSLLAQAGYDGSIPARKALEELSARYWGPVHQFIRSRNIPDPQAQDLTQDFMVHLLEKSLFTRADPLQGRFRSFLLGALVRFLADASVKAAALKRGGNRPHASLDDPAQPQLEELACQPEVAAEFDREWALTILETALERVHSDYAEKGRQAIFATLRQYLPGSAEAASYELSASQLGLSLGALKTEIHRLRRQLRACIHEEVAQTVATPHELEDEIRYLQQVLMERNVEFTSDLKLGTADS